MATKMWWFRGLSADLVDPQLHEMSAADFRAWYFLTCVANGETPRGSLPAHSALAFHLHLTQAAVVALVNRLKGWGKLEERDGRLWIAGADQRFKDSDNATQRMANIRAERRSGSALVQNTFGTNEEQVRHASISSSSSGAGGAESTISAQAREDAYASAPDQAPTPEEEEERAVLNTFRTHLPWNPTVEARVRVGIERWGSRCMAHCLTQAAVNNKLSMGYVERVAKAHVNEGCPSEDEEGMSRYERMTAG